MIDESSESPVERERERDRECECEVCGGRIPAAVYREHLLKEYPGPGSDSGSGSGSDSDSGTGPDLDP